jgi:hypothetical protein
VSDPTTTSLTVLDQDVTSADQSLDARRDVHCHPLQRAPFQLTFAGVDTGPNFNTETPHGLSLLPWHIRAYSQVTRSGQRTYRMISARTAL